MTFGALDLTDAHSRQDGVTTMKVHDARIFGCARTGALQCALRALPAYRSAFRKEVFSLCSQALILDLQCNGSLRTCCAQLLDSPHARPQHGVAKHRVGVVALCAGMLGFVKLVHGAGTLSICGPMDTVNGQVRILTTAKSGS